MEFLTGVHECDWYHIQFIYGVYWGVHCDGKPNILMPNDGDGGGEDFLQVELDLWSQQRIVTHIDFPRKFYIFYHRVSHTNRLIMPMSI